MPLISVIVPVYKVEKYLHDCIKSILAQSFTDFELILVDDGSPDNCGSICDQYAAKDKRISVIHQSNMGLSGARNSGIEASKGELITFVDSDDFVSCDYLEYLLSILLKYGAEMSCVYYQRINTDLYHSSKIIEDFGFKFKEKCLSSKECCLELFDISADGDEIISITATGKLMKKSLVGTLRFPVGRIHEDEYFTPQVCYKASKIVASDLRLYYYRVVPDSIINQGFSLKRYDGIWAIDQCINYFSAEQEHEIVIKAQEKKEFLISTYAIQAMQSGINVPIEYRRSWFTALNHIGKMNHNKVQYYIFKVSPKLALWYEYYVKIKSILFRNR